MHRGGAFPGAHQSDDVARVLDATDIVRLIGDHVALKKKGKEYACLCPFHDDHNPSMYVVPGKGIYKCFVCGAGGDALTFARDYHKMSFREALQFLADRAGLTLTPFRPHASSGPSGLAGEDDGPEISRADLRGANASACDFYRVLLKHPEHGAAARAVLEQRGVSPEMIERFALGAAPDLWDGLDRFVRSKGLPTEHYLAAGLLKARERGEGNYDALRHRLIFPIHDQAGHVIGFGGRKLRDEDEPKYLNSPETSLFSKSQTLYGLYQGGESIRKSGRAIVVEGYMDVIACHQAGLTTAVAALGTALTEKAFTKLRSCVGDTGEIVLLFDGDTAGKMAADRVLSLERAFIQYHTVIRSIRIASMHELYTQYGFKDADEALKSNAGKTALLKLIDDAPVASKYFLEAISKNLKESSESTRYATAQRIIEKMAGSGIDKIPPAERDRLFKEIKECLKLDYISSIKLLAPFAANRDRRAITAPVQDNTQAKFAGIKSSFDLLLACAVAEPGLLNKLKSDLRELIAPARFEDESLNLVARSVESALMAGGPVSQGQLQAALNALGVGDIGAALCVEVSRLTGGQSKKLLENWHHALASAPAELAYQRARASGDFGLLREAKMKLDLVRQRPAAGVG